MRHELHIWREKGPIQAAADSLLERLAEDPNLPGVERLQLAVINSVFNSYFPGMTSTDSGRKLEPPDASFQVSFSFDGHNQPTNICITSDHPLVETPEIFDRIFLIARELDCTKIESVIK